MAPDGQKILYYVFVGNGSWDQALGVGVDASGSAVISGDTRNTDFPLTHAFQQQFKSYTAGASNSLDFPLKNAMQTTITPRNGWSTPLLIKLSADGSISAATFAGGPVAGYATGIALDQAGNVYLGGYADSALATKNAFQARSESSTIGFLL